MITMIFASSKKLSPSSTLAPVGLVDGEMNVGGLVGEIDGEALGLTLGATVSVNSVGCDVGLKDGLMIGERLGINVGPSVGEDVGMGSVQTPFTHASPKLHPKTI